MRLATIFTAVASVRAHRYVALALALRASGGSTLLDVYLGCSG